MSIRLFFLALFAALLAAPTAAEKIQQGNLRAAQAQMVGHMMDVGIEQDKHYVGTEMETMDGTERRQHMGKKAKEVLKEIAAALNGEVSITATAQVGFSLCLGGGVAGNLDLGLKLEATAEIKSDFILGIAKKILAKFEAKKWSKLVKAFKIFVAWLTPANFKKVLGDGVAAWSSAASKGVSTAESGKLIDPLKASGSLELKLGIVVSPVSGGVPVPTLSLKAETSLSAAALKTQNPPFGLDWGKTLDGDPASDGSLGCIAELKASITVGTSGVATSASGPATWKCVGALVALIWEIVKAWAVKNFSAAIDKVSGKMKAVTNKLNEAKGDLIKIKNSAADAIKEKATKFRTFLGGNAAKETSAAEADKTKDSQGFAAAKNGFGKNEAADLNKQTDAVGSMFDEACDAFATGTQCDTGDNAADKTYDAQPALKKMSGFFKAIFSKIGGKVKATGADITKTSGWGFSLNFGVGLGDMSPGIKIYHQSDLKGTLTAAPGGDAVALNVDEFSAEK